MMTLRAVRVGTNWAALSVGDMVSCGLNPGGAQHRIAAITPNSAFQSGAEVYLDGRDAPIDPWWLWRDIPCDPR